MIVIAKEFSFGLAEIEEMDAEDLHDWVRRVVRLRQMEREASRRGN